MSDDDVEVGLPGPYDKDQVISLLIEHSGNISAVARELGRARVRVKAFIDKTPEVLEVLMDIREELADFAEDNFHKAVRLGDLGASKFILSTLGKDRGYTTGNELTGKDRGALFGDEQVNINVTFHEAPGREDK